MSHSSIRVPKGAKTSEFLKHEREKRNEKKNKKINLIEKQKKFDEELRKKNKQFMKWRESQPKVNRKKNKE